MTYTKEKINKYIDTCVNDMIGTVKFTREEILHRDGAKSARRWCLGEIKSEYDRGHGVLLFNLCYMKEITEYEYDEIYERLSEGREKAEELMWETVK